MQAQPLAVWTHVSLGRAINSVDQAKRKLKIVER